MRRWPLRVELILACALLTAFTGAVLLGMIGFFARPVVRLEDVSAPGGQSPPDAGHSVIQSPAPSGPELLDIQGTITQSVVKTGIIALIIVVAAAAALGWLTARRALRPIRYVTSAARRAAGQDLTTRIRMSGPHDEIRELADTFDHMLARLDRSFEAQRRFVANAAHELKTPLAAQRAVTEVAIARPNAAPETISLGRKLLSGLNRQERLLAGLLALAQSAETVRRYDLVDLAGIVRELIQEQVGRTADEIELKMDLEPAQVRGDAVLLTQLVGNLVENAFVHNEPGGWISIRTGSTGASCSIEIANSGACLDDTGVDRLFEPFHRSCFTRADPPPGSGLGLSVVQAISEAHDGSVTARPRETGGLAVKVNLPAA